MMTTSKDREKPSTGGKTPSRRGHRTPLSRRLRYFAQDTAYAVKKAGRRVADPIRDARPKSRRRKPKPAALSATPKARRPATRKSAEKSPRAGERPARRRRPRGRRPGRARARASRPARRRPTAARAATAITRFGERCSRLIRGALAPLLVPFVGLFALGRRSLAWLASAVTPLRGVLGVALLAAVLLGVSQFVDYRGVAVGAPDYAAYSGADLVAPAPQVDREPAGSAHAYVLVPVAVLAIALLLLAARGRWQLGRVVSLLGVLAIAIALVVDAPAGLDESAQAIAYSGVEAHLIEGFWVQLVSAGVLVAGGLLVSRYARRERRPAPRARRRAAKAAPPRASTA